MNNKRATWWLLLGFLGTTGLWLAYLSDSVQASWFGLAYVLSPVAATLFTIGRDLWHDRITMLSLAGLTVLLCMAWLL